MRFKSSLTKKNRKRLRILFQHFPFDYRRGVEFVPNPVSIADTGPLLDPITVEFFPRSNSENDESGSSRRVPRHSIDDAF